ncbi:hypothetical protein MRB53_041810 [Persea americana]|nr:hypothetical protein MRB53_041810 [Persea americana]
MSPVEESRIASVCMSIRSDNGRLHQNVHTIRLSRNARRSAAGMLQVRVDGQALDASAEQSQIHDSFSSLSMVEHYGYSAISAHCAAHKFLLRATITRLTCWKSSQCRRRECSRGVHRGIRTREWRARTQQLEWQLAVRVESPKKRRERLLDQTLDARFRVWDGPYARERDESDVLAATSPLLTTTLPASDERTLGCGTRRGHTTFLPRRAITIHSAYPARSLRPNETGCTCISGVFSSMHDHRVKTRTGRLVCPGARYGLVGPQPHTFHREGPPRTISPSTQLRACSRLFSLSLPTPKRGLCVITCWDHHLCLSFHPKTCGQRLRCAVLLAFSPPFLPFALIFCRISSVSSICTITPSIRLYCLTAVPL